MTDLLKFVREWADFDKNTEYLFGYLHPTVSCCIPDPQLKITKFKIQLQLQNQVTVTVHHCPVQWRTLLIIYRSYLVVEFDHQINQAGDPAHIEPQTTLIFNELSTSICSRKVMTVSH